MRLIVGLGNPGARYAKNRHNIGFLAVDEIARVHRASPFRRRFQGEAAEVVLGTERAILLKPLTFMNDSGRSVGEAQRFYKVALEDVIVLHDELDLTPAKLRVKKGGGNAGHNGLRSITACCGNEYRRVRIGIGHPGDKALVHAFVLNDFAKSEEPWVEDLCRAVADNAAIVAAGENESFQNKVHLAMVGRGWADVKPPGRPAKTGD
ncbi:MULTISPECIES: aminoacyl-tRNA hydrolase [Methylobacterium]|uniref:Peptidyl-tRNA hydrolase n=1 Tax=Methylobacterium thuringiense TaxID=1003091 RepID=A0ABQ4TGN4_9HYPH|nr:MULTISPECIES: aminoacyl-tRNA hydrolase [Methylobacterium]TXN23811.1 aminoacyl-tRNA hydrolase [Methylobacterium sp. WL9]GJE54096.1 Peptidyl-tRNA hydrolase [Methylobacterium thuringiense]